MYFFEVPGEHPTLIIGSFLGQPVPVPLSCEDAEALEKAAQRSWMLCKIGWGTEQPGPVKGAPACGRAAGTR